MQGWLIPATKSILTEASRFQGIRLKRLVCVLRKGFMDRFRLHEVTCGDNEVAFRPDEEFDVYAPLINGQIMSLQQWQNIRKMADRFYSSTDEEWIEWWNKHTVEKIISRPTERRKQKISQPLRISVWRRDRFTCLACGSQDSLTCDHIIPESRGGEAVEDNLQTLCKSCNSKKGITTVDYRIQSPLQPNHPQKHTNKRMRTASR